MPEEKPDLLAANVNAWFRHSPSKRLLRTMDGTARAFLSNRYRCIDNYEIAQAGGIVSNSETSMGAVSIHTLIYRLVCSNGMIINDAQTRCNHAGRVNELDESLQFYSEQTLAVDDRAFILKV